MLKIHFRYYAAMHIAARQSHIKNLTHMTYWLIYAKKPTKTCQKSMAKTPKNLR